MKLLRGSHLLYSNLVILTRLLDISLSDLCKLLNNLHTASGMVLKYNRNTAIKGFNVQPRYFGLKLNGTPTLLGIVHPTWCAYSKLRPHLTMVTLSIILQILLAHFSLKTRYLTSLIISLFSRSSSTVG